MNSNLSRRDAKALQKQNAELLKMCKIAETALWLLVVLLPEGKVRKDAARKHQKCRKLLDSVSPSHP